MFDAIHFKQFDALRDLVEAGMDVQSVDAGGYSLLYRARVAGNREITDWLIAQGCRETFYDAVVEGDCDKAMAFITTNAACVTTPSQDGRLPLVTAVGMGKLEMITLLLEHGAKPDVPAAEGWNLLHIAAANDLVEVGRLLLKAGLPTNALTSSQMSPLEIAAAYGATNMAELLIQNGAAVNAPPLGGFKNTALHWAVHMGQVEMVKLLLAHGADLNVKNNRNGGETPLELARVSGNGNNMGFSVPSVVRKGFPASGRTPGERAAVVKLLEEATAQAKP